VLAHYFLPGAHNAYRPHFLRLKTASGIAALIVLLFVIALGVERLVIRSPSSQVGAVVASVLVELANADRAGQGLATLSVNPELERAAKLKALDMADKEYFAHQSPEGFEPWHWFEEAGYDFRSAGENLAVYFSDSSEVERAWMNSPAHRANILSDRYTEIGVALAHGRFEGRETTFVVQMFASPAEVLPEVGASTQAGAAAIVSSRESESEPGTVAGASAEAKPVGAAKEAPPSMLWRLLTAPRTILQYVYTTLAALILLAVSLLFFSELRLPRPERRGRLHVPSLIRGVGLLALIAFLLWGGTWYVSGQLLIA